MKIRLFLLFLTCNLVAMGQGTIHITIHTQKAAEHIIGVEMDIPLQQQSVTDLRMPAWSPGYYKLMDYGKNVRNFEVTDTDGKTVAWELRKDVWRVATQKQAQIKVRYEIVTEKPFIASAYIDEERAFIKPTAVFLAVADQLKRPVIVDVPLSNNWTTIATGLDTLTSNRYMAKDFDELYDSPILIGNLHELPSFTIKNKLHRFIGFNMGSFDETAFMKDVEKVVVAASDLIAEVPYDHYTFIGIDPEGSGGFEQLNSTAIAFSGFGMDINEAVRKKKLSLIAQKYFLHYSLKRTPPVELGNPFNYYESVRTNSLWVSEGLTAYYESIILRRAGIITSQELIGIREKDMRWYANNPKRLTLTLAAAGYDIWDGPFGIRGEKLPFYEKGSILGFLLDIKIRVATNNQKSLIDVIHYLHSEYYKKQNRGFTETELREAFEMAAGEKLDEIFDYIYTLKPLDYNKYLNPAGIDIEHKQTNNIKGDIGVRLTIRENLTSLQKALLADVFGSFDN